MPDPASDGAAAHRALLTLLLLAIAGGGALDLALDRDVPPWSLHALLEVSLLALCLVAVAALWQGWMRSRRSLARSSRMLEQRARERDRWRERAEKLLRGLGEEIDLQLARWGLTPAERETALLVLKGYGHGEIAALLGKSERTVRQQAGAVYRKSALSGRAELQAFFLEDLLLPAPAATYDAGTAPSPPGPP